MGRGGAARCGFAPLAATRPWSGCAERHPAGAAAPPVPAEGWAAVERAHFTRADEGRLHELRRQQTEPGCEIGRAEAAELAALERRYEAFCEEGLRALQAARPPQKRPPGGGCACCS
eukprot:TRINITY_DN25250_c2_g2_i1.p5 TRINITY_DN25250_c2_g2~~TRINITY_DN25250_c2_g2_i1.p5  ORF type:complete len:117 (+),score=31.72 TRINITY_DN25250_c2_g2_i1:108-458(+)